MLTTLLVAVALLYLTYIARSLWIARSALVKSGWDTIALYVAVAPILTLGVDVLTVSDRIFYKPTSLPRSLGRARRTGLTCLKSITAR